jgi:glycosyltransferase involved in cell wall biosynthesis
MYPLDVVNDDHPLIQRDPCYHLAKRGHEITMIYPTTKKIDANSVMDFIPFPAWFFPKIHYTLPFFDKEYQILSELIKKEKCDIIHAYGYESLTTIVPILMKKKFGIPIVLSSDGLVGTSWLYGNTIVDSIAKMYTCTIGKFLFNSYDSLVFVNKNASKEVSNYFGIHKEKIHTISKGVNFEQFNLNISKSIVRDRLGIKSDEKVLLFVGRLVSLKRVDILIGLTKRLLKDDFKIKTIIVGDGEYRKKYEKLAMSLKIKKNIIFVGPVPHEEMHKYFAAADVIVHPSLSEGFPNVLLEAAACGKPIVATNTGGIPDIVIHEETGFLAKSKDVDSFVRYTKLLLTDEDLSRRFGKNAYEHVKKNFTWDRVVREYEQLYLKLVDGCTK